MQDLNNKVSEEWLYYLHRLVFSTLIPRVKPTSVQSFSFIEATKQYFLLILLVFLYYTKRFVFLFFSVEDRKSVV